MIPLSLSPLAKQFLKKMRKHSPFRAGVMVYFIKKPLLD